jgi:hypothetical protein
VPRSPDQNSPQVSQSVSGEKEKSNVNTRWEPSREIPNGTVKGRLSSFYGGQSISKEKDLMNTSSLSKEADETDDNLSIQASIKDTDVINDDDISPEEEDQWIIPERNTANTQVFASEWGEAIAAKSAESEDWDTPAKEWIRSGESQTEASSSNEVKEKEKIIDVQESSPPSEISTPLPNEAISQTQVESLREPEDHSPRRTSTQSILSPPPRDANAYHKPKGGSRTNQKTTEISKILESHSPTSQVFSDNFENFAMESETIPKDNSTVINHFSTPGSSDAFGFPVSTAQDMVANQDIGEIVGGDEFFDSSVLPNDYSRPVNENRSLELEQYPSLTTTISVEDDANNSVSEPISGKKDSKKKRKGFFKGLFGRKSKDSGKAKQSSKDNKKMQSRKDPSYSMTNNSEGSLRNVGNDAKPLNRNGRKSKPNVDDSLKPNQMGRLQEIPTNNTIANHSTKENDDALVIDEKKINDFENAFSIKTNAYQRSMGSTESDDNIFDGLEPDSAVSKNVEKNIVEEAFLDPGLDHLDSDSDEESDEDNPNRNSIVLQPSPASSPKKNSTSERQSSEFDSEGLLNNVKSEFDREINAVEEKKLLDGELEQSLPASRIVRDTEKSRAESSANTNAQSSEISLREGDEMQTKKFDPSAVSPDEIRNNKNSMLRRNAPVYSQYSSSNMNSASGTYFVPKRYTKNSVFNRASNVHDDVPHDELRGIQQKESTYARQTRQSRNATSSQNSKEKIGRSNSFHQSSDRDPKNSKKFSRAARAYNSISKKSTSEDYEDQRKYFSIPAASTSASGDMSCSSTFDSYQKKLSDSLRKAKISKKSSHDYSLQSQKSLDDSSIESDIRVLRTILRRPRSDHDSEKVIAVSRQIEGFPTYDTESATDPMQRVGLRLLASAILPIQTEVRRFLAMRQALTRMWALIIVQTYARRFLARKRFQKAKNSAVAIQAVLRGHLARNDVIDKHICAIEIQRYVRGYLATMQVYEDIYKVTLVQSLVRMKIAMDYAAYRMSLVIQVQAIARGFLARRRLAHLDSCATLIQSNWRCFYNRLTYQFDLLDIIIVQSVWRKKLGERVAALKVEEKRNTNATVIQSLARMYFCRLDYADYRSAKKIQSVVRMYLCRYDYAEYKAATTLQATVRMFLCRSGYVEYKCAKKIQSIVRMYLQRVKCTNHQATIASIKIQAKWRSYDCQMNFLHFLADVLIVQSTIRRYLVQKKVKAMKNHAAIVIQRTWRGLICYIDYHEYLTVRRIQSAWRGYVCRRNYKREKAAIVIQCAWRGFLFYADYMFELSDIVVVQKQIRCWLAKRVADQRRIELQTKRVEHASTVIQTYWRRFWCFSNFIIALDCSIQIQAQIRGYQQRKEYLSQISMIREITNSTGEIAKKHSMAAIKIQQVFRGSLCRNALKVYLAAVLIQSRVRGRQARVAVRLFFAVRKIQALWRAFTPRRSYATYIAARKIQATWRGYTPRQAFITFKREFNAASLIQSAWRGFVSYTDFVFTLSDVVAAQRFARGYLSRKKYHSTIRSNINKMKGRMNGAVAIQKVYRGFQARQNYWYTLGCTMQIQSWWRGRRICLSLEKQANAILTLQCFARCSLARQEYMQRRFVLMLIQTAEQERSKKLKVQKIKEQQVREDMERQQRDDQLQLAKKRRKKSKKQIKKGKYPDDVDEALLEDVWIGLVAHSNSNDEAFTQQYTNFDPRRVGSRKQKQQLSGNINLKPGKQSTVVNRQGGASNADASRQSTGSKFSPHPTSSVRMVRKVDAIDMDADFQLEEAFIDAEICHAKERRHYAGGSGSKKIYPH